jgi:hypothetical protein
MRTSTVREWTQLLNKHSKISEDNHVIFIADKIGNVILGIIFLSDGIKTNGICQAKKEET